MKYTGGQSRIGTISRFEIANRITITVIGKLIANDISRTAKLRRAIAHPSSIELRAAYLARPAGTTAGQRQDKGGRSVAGRGRGSLSTRS